MKALRILFGVLGLAAVSCGDSESSGSGGSPKKAVLISPINNSECLTGTPVSSTQTSVTFEWNPSENTDNYFLYVKNLETGNTSQYNAGAAVTYSVTLSKATPYSWYVSSRKEGRNPANSDTWKFYNAGDAIENYAPFPAEVISPAMSSIVSGSSVTLEWSADDVDGDIVDYKVYFGTASNPTTLLSTLAQTSIANVPVVTGSTYYWKVVTTDEAGNSSTSQTFQFKAQ